MKKGNLFTDVNDNDLATCVGCGLCLPLCPTYRVTGEDSFSPRGRINLIEGVKHGLLELDASVKDSLLSCIQCRGCEPACPSGVPYGKIIEAALPELLKTSYLRRILFKSILQPLRHPKVLRLLTRLASVLQKIHIMPKKMPLPVLKFRFIKFSNTHPLSSRFSEGRSSSKSVVLFTGCVMDSWYRDVHQATIDLLRALSFEVEISGDAVPCCGALHEHSGFHKESSSMQHEARKKLAGRTVLVNSAGCGASLKASLKDVAEVLDIHEFFKSQQDEIAKLLSFQDINVIIQDPCHLRHVQKSHTEVLELLQLCYPVFTIPDDGLCCGAGGLFSISQPKMSSAVREQKIDAIKRVAQQQHVETNYVVASANPGCMSFLAAAGSPTTHPVTLLADALIK